MIAEEFCDSRRNRWFALRVKPRFEKTVATIARNKGYEEFLPVYQSRRRWSDRCKVVEVPLFPGYVFCRLDPQRRLPLLTIPGALHFVGIGNTPVPLEDAQIAAIRTSIRSGLNVEPWPYLAIGQRVKLGAGPLAGVEGIYVGGSKQHRIIISVTLLRRSVAIIMERHWVEPLDVLAAHHPWPMTPPQLAADYTRLDPH